MTYFSTDRDHVTVTNQFDTSANAIHCWFGSCCIGIYWITHTITHSQYNGHPTLSDIIIVYHMYYNEYILSHPHIIILFIILMIPLMFLYFIILLFPHILKANCRSTSGNISFFIVEDIQNILTVIRWRQSCSR
jgi:hypothetical protein